MVGAVWKLRFVQDASAVRMLGFTLGVDRGQAVLYSGRLGGRDRRRQPGAACQQHASEPNLRLKRFSLPHLFRHQSD